MIAGTTCIAIAALLGRSLLGLSMRAVIERREAATIVGVDVDRVQAISFALGFATAALAGALVSMLEQISPFTGFPFTIAAFIVIILGGLGNLVAGLGAALLLGAIETYGVALTSANVRSVLLYGAFVAALLLFPQRPLRAPRARAADRWVTQRRGAGSARASSASRCWRRCRSSPTPTSSRPA